MRFLIVNTIFSIVSISSVYSLLCYKCNTLAGHTGCTQDNFNVTQIRIMTCNSRDDVCVAIVSQKPSDAVNIGRSVEGGYVIRGCGKSNNALPKALSIQAPIPSSGKCSISTGAKTGALTGYIVTACASNKDLSNGKVPPASCGFKTYL